MLIPGEGRSMSKVYIHQWISILCAWPQWQNEQSMIVFNGSVCSEHKITYKKWNNVWLIMNNDFLVASEQIHQWFSLVTVSLKKICCQITSLVTKKSLFTVNQHHSAYHHCDISGIVQKCDYSDVLVMELTVLQYAINICMNVYGNIWSGKKQKSHKNDTLLQLICTQILQYILLLWPAEQKYLNMFLALQFHTATSLLKC